MPGHSRQALYTRIYDFSAETSNPTVSEGTGCVLPPARGFVEVYRVAYGHLFLEMRLEEDSSKRLVDT